MQFSDRVRCGKTLASKAVFPHKIDKADNENESELRQTIYTHKVLWFNWLTGFLVQSLGI